MRMRILLLSLSILMFAGTAVQAQDINRLNAATWYQRGFAKYHLVRMLPAENEALWRFQVDPSLGPSPGVRQFLHRIEPALNLTRRAAHQSVVDFGIDADDGPDVSYEHLGELRTLHWLVGYDLQFKIAEGDHYGAADRLGTMYRMANHAAADPMMIGSVVGYAMFEIAERNLKFALDHAAIGQSEAAMLMKAMEVFDRADPFHIRAAISHERERTTQWMLKQYSGEGGAERFNEELADLPLNADQLPEQITALDQENLEREMVAADRMMQRIGEAFGKGSREAVLAELAQIQQQANDGEFGQLAPHLTWGSIDQLTMLLSAREAMSARVAMLKSLADGTRDPMDMANAAVWYMRAIAVLPRIDPQNLETLREYAAVHDAPVSGELASTFDEIEFQEILQHVTQATRLQRCNFAYTTPPWPTVLRRYHPGMRDLARLLVADAARLLHLGEEAHYTAAAPRIAMVNRLCVHLAQDKSIAGALIAHAAFKQNDALAEAGTSAKYLHGESLREISRSARFRAVDPFGYEVASGELRDDVEKRMVRLFRSASAESISRVKEFVAKSDADRLLWLQVILDQSEAGVGPGASQANAHLQNLDDVINAEAFHEAMAQADVVRRMILKRDFEPLAGVEVPPIAKLKERQEEAFSDLRKALTRMRR